MDQRFVLTIASDVGHTNVYGFVFQDGHMTYRMPSMRDVICSGCVDGILFNDRDTAYRAIPAALRTLELFGHTKVAVAVERAVPLYIPLMGGEFHVVSRKGSDFEYKPNDSENIIIVTCERAVIVDRNKRGCTGNLNTPPYPNELEKVHHFYAFSLQGHAINLSLAYNADWKLDYKIGATPSAPYERPIVAVAFGHGCSLDDTMSAQMFFQHTGFTTSNKYASLLGVEIRQNMIEMCRAALNTYYGGKDLIGKPRRRIGIYVGRRVRPNEIVDPDVRNSIRDHDRAYVQLFEKPDYEIEEEEIERHLYDDEALRKLEFHRCVMMPRPLFTDAEVNPPPVEEPKEEPKSEEKVDATEDVVREGPKEEVPGQYKPETWLEKICKGCNLSEEWLHRELLLGTISEDLLNLSVAIQHLENSPYKTGNLTLAEHAYKRVVASLANAGQDNRYMNWYLLTQHSVTESQKVVEGFLELSQLAEKSHQPDLPEKMPPDDDFANPLETNEAEKPALSVSGDNHDHPGS